MIGKVYAEPEGNNTVVIWPYQGIRFFQLVDSQYGLFVADFNQLYGNWDSSWFFKRDD